MAAAASSELAGKVMVVTGASRGIGRAIAAASAEAGANVMLTSRRQQSLDEAATAIGSAPGDVATFAANAGDPDAPEACMAATVERFGTVDILVNNAATNPYLGPTIDIDVARFDKTVQVNLRGPLLWSQAAWRASMRDQGGVIINVASIGGIRSGASIGAYDTTKAGLIHLTRVLAGELAPAVRVNAIAPGLVKTDMARALWEPNEEAMARTIPLHRLGEPIDIARAAVFLASDASGWITGATVVVDGGMLLR